jgi:predicted nucleic acid-binding protein
MIILDTNVVSALMKPAEHEDVVTWFDSREEQRLWTTSITLMEVRYGLLRMQDGRRRRQMEDTFDNVLSVNLHDVLPFDFQSAEITATILAKAHASGRNLKIPDCQIAGIAIRHRATLATRNIRDFDGLGLKLVNPWD